MTESMAVLNTYAYIGIHKTCYDHQTGMKLAGIVELLYFYQPSKFQILIIRAALIPGICISIRPIPAIFDDVRIGLLFVHY